MPSLYYRVEAPGVNILETVQSEAVNGLLSELDLERYFTDNVYIMSSFMASSQYASSKNVPKLTTNRCDVEVSYVMDKSQVPWPVETPYTTDAYGLRSSTKGNHTPLLIDEKAGILIEHQTTACALEMNFTLSFITFDEACKAFDTIQSKYKGSLIQTPFHLAFSYPVTMGMYKYLVAVYKAKTDYKDKTFIDYINDTKITEISFDVRRSQLTDPNADQQLMIRCQQLNCLAQITMDQKEPEVVRDDDVPDYYTVSFSMVLQFGRPTRIGVHTPVSVDNVVLPNELFKHITTSHHDTPNAVGVYQDLMIHEFMSRNAGNYNNAQRIVRMPVYDDWFSVDRQYSFYQYRPLLIAHFTLDGDTTTINLGQLGDISLHDTVKDILKETGDKVFQYGGLFNIGIYADNLRLGAELVHLDRDLNLTIKSNRPDKVYHLVLSETTSLFKMDMSWDRLLVKYRYFFPLTIERNLKALIDKRYFRISYDDSFLGLIARLEKASALKHVLSRLVLLGEDTNGIYHYTQNPSQLADYLVYTQSKRDDWELPTGTSEQDLIVQEFYKTKTSTSGRSLFIAFLEQCLILDHLKLDDVPMQYITPNKTVYPYYNGQGGYYGFNTPLRVINHTIIT